MYFLLFFAGNLREGLKACVCVSGSAIVREREKDGESWEVWPDFLWRRALRSKKGSRKVNVFAEKREIVLV